MLSLFMAIVTAQPAPAQPTPTAARQIAGSISDADYPPSAIRAGEQGTAAMQINVDEAGSVTSCEILESSGSAALDSASCALVTQRFRYEPARNSQGKAVPGIIRRRINWVLPADAPGLPSLAPFRSFWAIYTAKVEGKEVRSCSVQGVGTPSTPVPAEVCARLFDPILAWATQRGGVASLTQVVAFTVAGQLPPPVQAQWGQVLFRADADVTVGPHGGNARCTVTRMERAPDAGPLAPADPCSLSGGGVVLFEPAGDAAAPREGRAIIATFAERAPPEAP